MVWWWITVLKLDVEILYATAEVSTFLVSRETSVIIAEFSAVFYGLKFLVDKGFSKIMAKTDSMEAEYHANRVCVQSSMMVNWERVM